MSELSRIKIDWHPREHPLAPLAVAARGNVARALAHRLLARTDDALLRLKGAAGRDVLIILADEESLTWVDGVIYLGRDELAPSLLLPTTRQPSLPVQLFERALRLRFKESPLAVLIDPAIVIPVSAVRPVARESLINRMEAV